MFLISKDSYKVKQTAKKGRGVFAQKEIKAGTIIGDYLGKIVDDCQLDEYENKFGFYAMEHTAKTFIFPDLSKDGIYLINHSCFPNMSTISIETHCVYFSLRKIFKGEEITADYRIDLPREGVISYPCLCDSEFCRGTMIVSQKKIKLINEFQKKIKDKKADHIDLKVGEELKVLDSYPDEIKDREIDDIYPNFEKEAIEHDNIDLPPIKILRELIRETGRKISFPKINTCVIGVKDNMVLVQPIKKIN
ncbi:MAG: SET domain-containing protein-lysine N-methyltransferase [Candidatus Falkowbacteria bacterium]|nr:SET domain-containing protein-lysine N-methyltransferase [Candidatus Falkowbacteria bacterium]